MDLMSLVRIFGRRWGAVALCTTVGFVAAYSSYQRAEPVYESTTRLFLTLPAANEVQEALLGAQLSSQLLASYARIATSNAVAEEAARRLRRETIGPDQVRGHIKAEPVPDTLLLNISATAGDPRDAQQLADAAAAAFVAVVDEIDPGRGGTVRPRVIDGAQLPGAPISPRPTRDVGTGVVIGLIGGWAVAVTLEFLDRSVRGPEELHQLSGAPLLAMVPRRKDIREHPVLNEADAGSPAAEAYRVLRTAVRFLDLDQRVKTLMVTSPTAAEGKTTTAANLAVALAESGERVIAVDADLRRTALGDAFGVHSDLGLTSVVIREARLEETLVPVRERLRLLPAGLLPPNPSEILGSEAMAETIRSLRNMADVVIFDCAPLLPVADAQVLATQTDGVLLVARCGRTQRDQVTEARRRLEVVGERIVGTVLNAVPSGARYNDEYGYYSVARQSSAERSRSILRPLRRARQAG